jgi:CheY-like chemotaxis protein
MKKILIAEDDSAGRELLRELLAGEGYQVVEARDGEEAWTLIAQEPLELVILDIQMPVLDGFALLRRLRRDPRFARLPALAVSAYAMRGDRERALQAGFDGYVTKPVNAALLKAEIQRLLGGPAPPARPVPAARRIPSSGSCSGGRVAAVACGG